MTGVCTGLCNETVRGVYPIRSEMRVEFDGPSDGNLPLGSVAVPRSLTIDDHAI